MAGPVEYRLSSNPIGLVIVGEAPGEGEIRSGQPFTGPAGRYLDDCLAKTGLCRDEIDLANTFRFRPNANKVSAFFGPKTAAVNHRLPAWDGNYVYEAFAEEIRCLWRFLRWRQPKVIVATGNTACWALLGKTGITKLRGHFYATQACSAPVMATFHPSYCMRQERGSPIPSPERGRLIGDLAEAARRLTSH